MLDSHVALCWRVSLGSVPSSSQSKWSANPLQDHHNWQCTKDHSGRVTRSLPARQKARRTGVKPFVTNSTKMRSSWSTRRGYLPTLGLPCQMMCTFWPAFFPQGHKELTRILYIIFTTSFPKIITDKCPTPCHAPKHAASQAATLVGTPQEHTIQPVERLRASPTNLNFPWSQPRALAQHGI